MTRPNLSDLSSQDYNLMIEALEDYADGLRDRSERMIDRGFSSDDYRIQAMIKKAAHLAALVERIGNDAEDR